MLQQVKKKKNLDLLYSLLVLIFSVEQLENVKRDPDDVTRPSKRTHDTFIAESEGEQNCNKIDLT